MVGIISNSAALFAQSNLQRASFESQLSIGRLSSGERIIRASDDVSGLAIGTVLATNVSTLRTVLTSTSQASSLLQIADGGLKNVSDILQRQKALAVQANSGTLSDTERAFLDEEFQNLTSEINRLVANTNFNGIRLLDGSISGTANVGTATGATTETFSLDAATDFTSSGSIASGAGFANSITFNNGFSADAVQGVATLEFINNGFDTADTITIDGFVIDFGVGGNDASVAIGATLSDTLENLVNALDASTNTDLAQLRFEQTNGNALVITNNVTGVNLPNGTNFNTLQIAYDLSNATAEAVLNGDLTGTGSANTLVATNLTTGAGGAGEISRVAAAATTDAANDTFAASLQGNVTAVEGSYIAGSIIGVGSFNPNAVELRLVIGGETYTATAELSGGRVNDGAGVGNGTSGLGDTILSGSTLTFRRQGADLLEGSFTLTTNADISVTNQAGVNTLAGDLQLSFTNGNFTVNQTREVSTFDTTLADGTILDGIAATDITLTADIFAVADGTLGNIGSFNVDRNTDTITVTINGEEFTADLTAVTGYEATATNVLDTDGGAGTATVVFNTASTTDGRTLSIDLTGITATEIDISNDAGERALESALNAAFGVGNNASLNFQTGIEASDSIGLSLASATSSELFKDANGQTVALSIATAGEANSENGGDGTGAILASNVLDRAINTVTSLRATVGALQSRFEFAAANISTSIQNTEAARSDFLDVDIAEESTNFATAQVRLQASISVLAQANQLPQNLLKLLG